MSKCGGMRRLAWLLAGLALWPGIALAGATAPAPLQTPSDSPAPECVGLVLGGGGARGAAHIGVLKVMEREHIPVCAITGTSMGAIVGGLYATGYDAAELERLIETIDWADMFVDDPPRAELPIDRKEEDFRHLLDLEIGYRNGRLGVPVGLVYGQKLMLLLRRLTLSTWRAPDFDALPIRFRAVSADIVTGKKVVFADGDVAVAILTFIPLAISAWATLFDHAYLPIPGIIGTILCAITVYCTAMIYASLKSVQAWNTRLTPVCYLLLAAAGGAVLAAFFALCGGGPVRWLSLAAIVLIVAALGAAASFVGRLGQAIGWW